MVEDGQKGAERNQHLPEIGRRGLCLRISLVLLVFFVFLLYYLDFSQEALTLTMQMIYNKTKVSAEKIVIFPPVELSTTAIPSTTEPISTTSPPTTTPEEPCMPETKYHVAYPCRYHLILNEPERCQKDNPFLVLMVPVAPSNKEARDAVRSTWGSETVVMEKVVRLFFMLGQTNPEMSEEQHQKLLQESEEHHDLLQCDFLDSYSNLTIKTMMIMEWLSTYCKNTVYAMKIDSDMFLNLNNLVNMLLNAPRENYMTGLVAKGGMVLRNPNSKWYLPKDVFFEDFYPPYALGLGYVLSIDLPKKLVEGARQVKAVYIEDVYLGLCMRHLGIAFTSQWDQSLFNVFPVAYDRCIYSKIIASTTRNLNEQVNAWKEIKKPGPHCG